MNRIENTVDKFSRGYACSQAILSEYCERFNLDTETALKLAAGFAGGMRSGETCGVVTGGYMVLGLKFGTRDCEKPDGRKPVYEAVCEFKRKFEEIHEATGCEALLGCNIGTADGIRKAMEEKLFQTICPGLVKSAAEILESMLD